MNSEEIQASDAKIHQKRLETNDHGKGSYDDDEADAIVQCQM